METERLSGLEYQRAQIVAAHLYLANALRTHAAVAGDAGRELEERAQKHERAARENLTEWAGRHPDAAHYALATMAVEP
jgi:hypothetical protein